MTIEPINKSSLTPDKEVTAGIGDIFFHHVEGSVVKDPILGDTPRSDSIRFDLTITELSDSKIGLQYDEYFYNLSTSAYARSGWAIKPGFTKKFEYPLGKKITFKDYEFEIVSIEDGRIRYRRVK